MTALSGKDEVSKDRIERYCLLLASSPTRRVAAILFRLPPVLLVSVDSKFQPSKAPEDLNAADVTFCVAVATPVDVAVLVGVLAAVAVSVGVLVDAGVSVDVLEGVLVGVAVSVGVLVDVGVSVDVLEGVLVGVTVSVAVAVKVGVSVAPLVSMIHVRLAGVGSILPAASMATTSKVWDPSTRSLKV